MVAEPHASPPSSKAAWREFLKTRLAERIASPNEAEALAARFCSVDPEARCVLVYAATASEAPTAALMQKLWNAGVRVALPVISDGETQTMDAYAVDDDTQLVADRFGIAAPALDCRTPKHRVDPTDIDAVAVPGLGFDVATGVRLGRGGGYYDRYLARCPEARRVGLAFDEQLVQGLPAEAHDIPMHAVITPTRTLRFDQPK
ncbi:MAG: 5-formyltetrahydrofolate cyclo-ligase [Planctomycetota bacterium]